MIRRVVLIAQLLRIGMVDAGFRGHGLSFNNALSDYMGMGSGSGVGSGTSGSVSGPIAGITSGSDPGCGSGSEFGGGCGRGIGGFPSRPLL